MTGSSGLPNELGCLFGCLAAAVLLFAWLGAAAAVAGNSHGCQNSWLPRTYYLATVGVCVAALWGGVRAARRGQSGLSILLMIPAIVVLLPATPCALSALSMCQ